MKEASLLMVDALGMSHQWNPFGYDRKVKYGRAFRECILKTELAGDEGLVDGLLVSDTALLLFPNLAAAIRFGARLYSNAIVTPAEPLGRVYLRGVILSDSGATSVNMPDQNPDNSKVTVRRVRHSVATSFILEKAGIRGMRLTLGFKNYPPPSSGEYEDDWAIMPDHLFPDHEREKVANYLIRLDDSLYPVDPERYGLNWDVDWYSNLDGTSEMDDEAWEEALRGMITEQARPTSQLRSASHSQRNVATRNS